MSKRTHERRKACPQLRLLLSAWAEGTTAQTVAQLKFLDLFTTRPDSVALVPWFLQSAGGCGRGGLVGREEMGLLSFQLIFGSWPALQIIICMCTSTWPPLPRLPASEEREGGGKEGGLVKSTKISLCRRQKLRPLSWESDRTGFRFCSTYEICGPG